MTSMPEPETPGLMRDERLRVVAYLREVARETMSEGDMDYAEFVDDLADRIAAGVHWEEPEEEAATMPPGEIAPQSAEVIDLMAALKASLAAAPRRGPS